MITRLTGLLESIQGHGAIVRPWGAGIAVEVLVPGYFARDLSVREGQTVTFHTFTYLEGQGQGTSFIPRLIGFPSPADRSFFDLFTTVKGIGNRKALRALDESPAVVAAAITRRDAKALTNLPEIGKRMAETVVAELFGKVEPYLSGPVSGPVGGKAAAEIEAAASRHPPAVEDAITALCQLGETRVEAERRVAKALERMGPESPGARSADGLLAAVYAGR